MDTGRWWFARQVVDHMQWSTQRTHSRPAAEAASSSSAGRALGRVANKSTQQTRTKQVKKKAINFPELWADPNDLTSSIRTSYVQDTGLPDPQTVSSLGPACKGTFLGTPKDNESWQLVNHLSVQSSANQEKRLGEEEKPRKLLMFLLIAY